MRLGRCLATLLAIAAPLAAGCATDSADTAGSSDGELSIGTTVAPITSIVANIGGERVRIPGIVPEGTNSHTFEPKPSVAELLSTIDVLYVNGLQLEEPTRQLAEQNMKDGADVVELGTKSISPRAYAYDFSVPRAGRT